jgi:hypothetical protein
MSAQIVKNQLDGQRQQYNGILFSSAISKLIAILAKIAAANGKVRLSKHMNKINIGIKVMNKNALKILLAILIFLIIIFNLSACEDIEISSSRCFGYEEWDITTHNGYYSESYEKVKNEDGSYTITIIFKDEEDE